MLIYPQVRHDKGELFGYVGVMETMQSPDGEPSPAQSMLEASERRWQLFGPTHLPYRILLLAKMIDRVTTQHVRDRAAMSLAEWRVISHVALMGQCSAAEIAEAAFVDRSEVSRAVAALEQRQLIQAGRRGEQQAHGQGRDGDHQFEHREARASGLASALRPMAGHPIPRAGALPACLGVLLPAGPSLPGRAVRGTQSGHRSSTGARRETS
jgi:hypothetical protein